MRPETAPVARGPEGEGGGRAASWEAVALLFGGEHELERDHLAVLPPPLARRLGRADRRHLEAEYVRLFVNALPGVPCPPYASAHLEGGVWGAVTGEVRDLYRRYGVEARDVPDHFAVEAAFVAALLEAADEDADAARDLAWITRHLRDWAPGFLGSIQAHDRTGVYAAAARWAEALIRELPTGPPTS